MDFKIGSYCFVILYATLTLGVTTALDLDNFLTNTRMELVGTINGKLFTANTSVFVNQLPVSQAICMESNSTVAQIESAEEEALITSYMASHSVESFWIDATDYPHEEDWHWASNHQKVTYGTILSNSKEANCAYLTQSGKMYAYKCTYPITGIKTICQIVI